MDAAVMPFLRGQRRASSAPCARLQPRQLHADVGDAQGGGVVVADQPVREADQDRRQGGEPRPLCHVPDGRGRGAAADVPGSPAVDRAAAGTAGAGISWLGLNGLRRREDYAFEHGKPANSSAVSYAIPGFGCQRGWLRSNFVATHPSETENPVC
jgi:hypothetical protein